MTHIEQMIQDLCPQGVEFKKLGEVTYWDKRFNEVERSMQPQIRKYHYYLASELEDLESPTGTIKILYTSNKIAYAEEETVAENVVDAEVVAIPWGGNANIKYFKGKFVTADNRIAVVRDTSILSTKFVYYWLKQNQEEIDSYYRGAGIKHPSMLKVLSFEIPIPPMEVQKRIVTVLDAYSALAAELQAELQLRRKQYEYYRTHLLTPHSDGNSADKSDDCNWVTSTLGEICENCYAGATPSTSRKDFWENGTIPWMSSGEVHQGHVTSVEKYITELGFQNSSTKWVPEDSVVIALAGQGKTRGCVALTKIRLCTNQSLCALIPKKDLILPEYLYQYLKTQYMQLRNVSAGDGTRGGLNLKMIREFPIVYPPLKEQARIVELLEKFDKLTMSMEEGIPAEQALQQRKYEYYRDLLLTFPRKDV